jgi:phosphomannomutase
MADALAAGEADVAGEESGGFALGGFSLDKDGMLAGVLLAEMAAREPLGRTLRRLERRFGRLACGRRSLPADPAACEALERLRALPPRRLAGDAVRGASDRDGLRLELDDGFLMLRRSGTEGVLRVYAEAPSARSLAGRLGLGEALLRTRGHGCPGRILSTAKA